MNKEKIYVNGVDVAECEQIFAQKKCALLDQVYCEDNPDCYYKQLKRLEKKYNNMVEISKENLIKYEDLRIDNQKLIMEIEGLNSQIDFEAQKQAILLQENEELKEQFEIETLKNNDTNECIYRSNLLNKYKHALEEIKKISRVNPVDSCWTLLYTCDNCSEKSECNHSLQSPFTVIREIKNIITEAIGE